MGRALRRWCLVALLGLGGGCGITGCEKRTEVVDVVFNSLTEYARKLRLQELRDQGYDCYSEDILNAFGAPIGLKYTCTGC